MEILNMFSLEGKKAVITGGAGILGSAIAKGLGKAGAEVALCDIVNADKGAHKLQEEGIKIKGYYIDVLDIKKINECYHEVINDFNRIDILINAAGGNIKEATTSEELSFFDLPLSSLEKVVGLNLFGGSILPCQVFGKHMVKNKEGGSIINISSMSAFRPLTRTAGYSAAKAAVSNFTQWLANHFAQEYNKKLRVNAIAPGFLLTQQNCYLLLDENKNLTPRAKSIISHTPMGKFGDPEDLIGACIWLASDASKFVTGIIVPIDGGFNAYSGVQSRWISFIKRVGVSNLGLLADTFHMNIEEVSIEDSLIQAKDYLTHVHFADSNRWTPGCGHFDFRKVIETLKKIDYQGYISAEILPLPDPDTAARITADTLNKLNIN